MHNQLVASVNYHQGFTYIDAEKDVISASLEEWGESGRENKMEKKTNQRTIYFFIKEM